MQFLPIILFALILVISIALHEYAHAYFSVKLGDPTPHLQWRNTPNPLKHIDPIWFIAIFIIWFGRWRPVITNPSYYKNPLRDEMIVALAWPITNFLLAIIWAIVAVLYAVYIDWATMNNLALQQFIPTIDTLSKVIGSSSYSLPFVFWYTFSFYNIALWIFNLIPFPPLDGYRIVQFLFPPIGAFFTKYYMYISFAVIGLLIFGWSFIGNYVYWVTNFVFRALLTLIFFIF